MIGALVGNLVGDYLLQNDWMALNKKKSSFVCSIHCFIWASCVTLFEGWGLVPFLILFVTHFIQDRTDIIKHYMFLMGQKGFYEFSPWSVIFVDNVWHILTIYLIWRLYG